MIDALIAGKLHAAPVRRTSKTGKAYCTARMTAAAGDATTLFANVICFEPAAVSALLALGAGDSLAVVGTATPRAYLKDGEPRASLDMVAHAVLTPYHVTRKRAAMQPEHATPERDRRFEAWEASR